MSIVMPQGEFESDCRSSCAALWLLLVGLILVAIPPTPLLAQIQDAATTQEQSIAVVVSRRADLLKRYLDSDVADRMRSGPMGEERDLIEKADRYMRTVSEALALGNYQQAKHAVAQGLLAYRRASNRQGNAYGGQARKAAKRKVAALREELKLYYDSFMSVLQERGPSAAAALDREHYQSLLQTAQQLSDADEYFSAQERLQEAQQMLLSALSQLRANETVVASLDFRTPADEYRYEYRRFKDYAALSKKMLNEAEPDERAKKLFLKEVAKAVQLGKVGRAKAQAGDYRVGISQLEQANQAFIRGLRYLGLPVM